MRRFQVLIVAGLIVAVLAGALFVSSALAQQPPGPPRPEQCQSVLPSQTVDPIVAKYQERFRTARDNIVKEERALQGLLIADATTRAALDAQMVKANEARNALSRVRLDMLWELRSVIPADNREQAFRCAQRALFRRR